MADCWETRFALDRLTVNRRVRIQSEVKEVDYLAELAADPDPYRDGSGEVGKNWIVEDVACALAVPSVVAAHKLHVARQLTTRFPATFAALRDALLDLRSATRLIEAAEHLPDTVLAGVEADALVGVEGRTFAQFCARLRRVVLRTDPRGADERHESQREQRRVTFTPVADGMTELWALLPAERAAALETELHRLADQSSDDDRTAPQRRADALCDLAGGGAGPSINVTVPVSLLLGESDEPGELAGYGAIPTSPARELAFDPTGTWRRLLTDANGNLVDASSRRYRPPAPMQRFVELRDCTCRFPTCNRPTRSRRRACEIDHVRDWAKGGETTPANLIPLCPRHHHLKHDGRWTVQRDLDGTVRWTSPTGRVHERPPPEPFLT